MKNEQLSHNDPDLNLSREIGKLRSTGEKPDFSDDPLMDYLLFYKSEMESQEKEIEAPSSKIWLHISKEIQPAQKKRIYKLNSGNSPVLKIAAAILLAALLTIVYLNRPGQMDLVADSAQQISTVTLKDNSTITLRPNSKIWAYSSNRNQTQKYHLEGEGYFSITRDTEREFVVDTKYGEVTVLGTRFNLSSHSGRMEVVLEEGAVEVKSARAGLTKVLKPGEQARIGDEEKIIINSNVNVDEAVSWMQNKLDFTEKSARAIFDELEFHFDITIQAPPEIEDEILGGTVSLADKEQSLNDLGLVLGGSFETDDGKIYTFSRN